MVAVDAGAMQIQSWEGAALSGAETVLQGTTHESVRAEIGYGEKVSQRRWSKKSSFGASQKLRQQRLGHADGSPVTETICTHVISEDGKRIAGQLGNAVWGILDASWTEKENGSGVEAPKPLYLN